MVKLYKFIKENYMILGRLTKKELRGLSPEEILALLKCEWDACILNEELKLDNGDKQSINVLKAYYVKRASMEFYNTSPDNPYTGKLNYSIFDALGFEDENTFTHLLKILYLNGYLQKVYVLDMDKFDLDAEFSEDFYNPPTKIIPHEHNLLWIFTNYRDMFSVEVLHNKDDEFKLQHNALFFGVNDSPEEIYAKMNSYGTVVELICSLDSVLSLSNRGMHLIHQDQYFASQSLLQKQQKILEEISAYKEEQEKIIEKNNKTGMELNSLQHEMKREFTAHRIKIKSFYKDIATILSILVAAFSVIGVNIHSIPNISKNFTFNILIINLTLVLTITVLLFLLKKMVFMVPGETEKRDSSWLIIIVFLLVLIGFLFYVEKQSNRISELELKTTNSLNGEVNIPSNN